MGTKAYSAAAGCSCRGAWKSAYRPAHRRSRRPAAWRLVIVDGLLAALASTAALASRTLFLAREELLCDADRIICIHGTLTYDVNDRLLWLRGRVQAAAVPGVLRITVRGSNRLGHERFAPMEIALRGRATEIVDFRMVPDWPDVANWSIDRIDFLPAGEGTTRPRSPPP